MASKERETDYFAEAMGQAKKTPDGAPRPAADIPSAFAQLLEQIRNAAIAKEERDRARTFFDRAMSEDSTERRSFRLESRANKYDKLSLAEAKENLENSWKAADLKGKALTDIIADPDQIKASAIAAELVARIAVPTELQDDYKVIYKKVAEAYASIDWKNISADEEAELRTTLETIFDKKVRPLAEKDSRKVDNAQLWRGLEDYYLSREISPDETPTGPQAEQDAARERNFKRENLRTRLRELQDDLSQPNSEREEKKILERASEDLLYGAKAASPKPVKEQSFLEKKQGQFLPQDVRPTRERLQEEIDQYETHRKRVKGVKSAEAAPPSLGTPQVFNESPCAEKSIVDPDLINKMKEINYALRNDPMYQADNHRLNNAKREILELGREKGVPAAQIQEAVGRMNDLIDKAAGGDAGKILREARSYTSTLGLSEEDILKVMTRPNGHQEVLDELLAIADANPSAEWRDAVASAQYKIAELQILVQRKFAGNEALAKSEAIRIGQELSVREKVHELTRLTSEGKFDDIIKFYGHIGPEEYDYLLESAGYAPQAVSAYDSALRSVMTDNRIRWEEYERQIQQRVRELIKVNPNDAAAFKAMSRFTAQEILRDASSTTAERDVANKVLKDQKRDEAGDFDARYKYALVIFGRGNEDAGKLDERTLKWRMGKTICPEDLQVSGELTKIIKKQNAIFYRDVQVKLSSGQALTPDEARQLANKALWDKYKADYEYYENWSKTRGKSIDDLSLTQEDAEIIKTGTFTPVDRRAYEILEKYLESKGIKNPNEDELRKSVINARNFSIITFHEQSLIANLSELAPGGAATAEGWVSTPFEDTIRALNKHRWLEERYRVGGATGEAFRILRDGYKPIVTGEKNGAPVYGRGKRLVDRETAEKFEKYEELKKRSGIDYELLGKESTQAVGGDLDATTWRARIAVLNRQEDIYHGLGFQIQEAASGSPEKKKFIRQLFERDPLTAMHYFPKDVKDVLRLKRVADKDMQKVWHNLEEALGIFELEVTYNTQFSPRAGRPEIKINHANILSNVFKSTDIPPGEYDAYKEYVASIVEHFTAEDFLNDAANLDLQFAMVISDVDWSRANFASLGQLEHNRRVRDITGSWRASVAEMTIENDPSPMNQEDFWKQMKEIQAGMQEFLGKENPKTNYRVYQNLFAYLEWNKNQLEWIPGWATLSGLLPTSYEGVFRRVFPHASLARSRKGPHAPAMDIFARNYFIDTAQRMELLTDLKMYDKLKAKEKTTLPWQGLYFLRWAIPIMIVSMTALAVKESFEEEKKRR